MSNAPEYNQHKQDPASFLMGGGVPSASFIKLGDSVSGTICEPPTLQQQRDMDSGAPKTWEDGNPMMQLVVTLQTEEHDAKIEDDDGRRRVYIKFNMKKAVAEAVRKAKAKELQVGGKLTVTYVSDGEATRRGFNPPKFYSATYTPPSAAFLEQEEPDGPSRVIVDDNISQPTGKLYKYAEAEALVAASGLPVGDFKTYLKAHNIKIWSPGEHSKLVLEFIQIALAARRSAPLDEEAIPF